jgi:hypothetical protein
MTPNQKRFHDHEVRHTSRRRAVCTERVAKIREPVDECTSEQRPSASVARVQVDPALHQQPNHLVEPLHLGMNIEASGLPSAARLGQLRIIA